MLIGYLERALNVRRNELVPALVLFSYLFLVMSCFIIGQAVGDTLFLNAFPNHLPHAIVGTAVVTGLFASVYIRLSHRVRLERLIIGSMLFFSASFVVFWWLTQHAGRWVYPLVYFWIYTSTVVGTTTGWTLANYVLTTREARRVFGLIGAGGILGATFGGFLTNNLTRNGRVHPETMLLGIALGLCLCAVLVKLLFWRTRERLAGLELAPAASPKAPRNLWEGLALLGSSRYLLLIMALTAVGCAATTIVGYQFKIIAKESYGANKAGLAAFFGSFYGYVGLASFFLQLIVTGRLLRSFGIRVTLFVLPALLFAGSAAVLLAPVLLTACLLRGGNNLVRYSLDRSSAELLYLPVGPDVKNQVKSFIDTFIYRLADGVAGFVLWLFANNLKMSASRMGLVNFLFLAGWVGVAYGVRREYLNVLRRAIERRALDPNETAATMLDSTTTEVLAGALERGDEQQVLYALGLFEVGAETAWHPMLRRLLVHPSPAVRERALRLLCDSGDREILPQVERMVGDEAPEVRTEALHYLVVHQGRDPISLMGEDMPFPDYSLQGAVVAYLARTGLPHNFATARLILEGMLSRNDAEAARSRAEAARTLGVIPAPSELHAAVAQLLADEDPAVAEQAIISSGKIQAREFLPHLILHLGDRRLAGSAHSALAQYGERAVGTLRDYLNDPSIPLGVRKQIPYALARVPSVESAGVLASSLIQSDPGLRYDVLKAMNKLRHRDPSLLAVAPDIESLLEAEVMGYYRSFQVLAAIDPEGGLGLRSAGAAESLLARAMRERMEYELERIFRLLALLCPAQDIHNAYAGLTSGQARLQANALEVLEHILRPAHYRLLSYGLDPEMRLQEKLAFAEQLCWTRVESKSEALRILLNSEDAWMRACALHAVGETQAVELRDEVRQVQRDGNPLLEETWRWAVNRLAVAGAAGAD